MSCPALAPIRRRTAPTHTKLAAAAALAVALFCAGLLPAAPAAAAANAPANAGLEIRPEQAQALGVQQVKASAAAAVVARYPAQVVLPSGQQQVVAAPLAGLVAELRVSAGDTVRVGQVLAVLRSPQAHELQREAHTAASQQQLAAATLQRDEALHREGLIAISRLEASRAAAQQATLMHDERRRAMADAGLQPGSGMLQLRAPISGVVFERLASVGERVDAAAPLLRLGSVTRLWVEMQVPVRELEQLRLGDTVKVAGSAASGRVLSIGQAVQAATQTVLVRAEFGSTAGLRVGQAVEALHERTAAGASQVPSTALTTAGGQPALFVAGAPGRYRITPVQVLGQHGGQAVVRGLPAGSTVVSAGVASLKAAMAAAAP